MDKTVEADFNEMERKLKCYVDKGRVAGAAEAREEPTVNVKPDASLVKPLKRKSDFAGSLMALELLHSEDQAPYYEYPDPRSNYLLLDGGGYFGGERKFRVSLYDCCEKMGVPLLAICKNY